MALRNDKKINSEIFSIICNSIINKIIKENSEDFNTKLFELGTKVGFRMADDYFLMVEDKKNMTLVEISENISNRFFPYYFSYKPIYKANIIFFKDFELLTKSINPESCLKILTGVLLGVYSYLSHEKIRFECYFDEGVYKISVMNESLIENPIISDLNQEAEIIGVPTEDCNQNK